MCATRCSQRVLVKIVHTWPQFLTVGARVSVRLSRKAGANRSRSPTAEQGISNRRMSKCRRQAQAVFPSDLCGRRQRALAHANGAPSAQGERLLTRGWGQACGGPREKKAVRNSRTNADATGSGICPVSGSGAEALGASAIAGAFVKN